MLGQPLISVLLPVYNGDKYLNQAIESILNQTYENFELIVLDDGSSDQSFEIAQAYQYLDKRVQVCSHENMGLCKTLQKGIELSSGKYIARMDADDISLPKRFELQVQYLEINPACVVIGTGTIVIDPYGYLLYAPEITQGHEQILIELLQWKGSRICHPTAMMKTETVREVGGYVQEYHYEDIDLFLKLAKIGKLENLPQRLLKHRLHLNSVCHTRNDLQLNEIKKKIYLSAIISLDISADFRKNNNLTLPQPIDTSEYYSEYEVYRRWSVVARRSGYYLTSLKYACMVFQRKPLEGKTYWTLLYFFLGERYNLVIWKIGLAIKQRVFR